MRWYALLLVVYSGLVLPNSFTISTDPKNPIANQNFYLNFEIETSSMSNPRINFNPRGLEVLGRENRGYSLNTKVQGQGIVTKRTINYSYEVVANRAGSHFIRDILVEVDGAILKKKSYKINVLNRPRKKKDFFVEASPSKTQVYLGEVINVNYYVYFRQGNAEFEVLEFPKLNNFLKSFSGVPSGKTRDETVEYNGAIYRKKLIYKAKLYPEKTGKLKIDSLRIKIKYVDRRNYNPFDVLSLRKGLVKSKNIRSKKIDVQVLPIPNKNVPPHFTGLVGRHSFKLNSSKSKFLVNEAIELRLEVDGPGALENYDGPQIYSGPNLEEFDTNSEIIVNEVGSSKKIFDYTYLGRGPIEIKSAKVNFAYFDPVGQRFQTVTIKIPPLEVTGPSDSFDNSSMRKEGVLTKNLPVPVQKRAMSTKGSHIAAPIFQLALWPYDFVGVFNSILFFIIIMMLLHSIFARFSDNSQVVRFNQLYKDLVTEGLTYSRLYQMVSLSSGINDYQNDLSIREMITRSTISKKAKKYFLGLIDLTERHSFNEEVSDADFELNKGLFKELRKKLKKNKNEAI